MSLSSSSSSLSSISRPSFFSTIDTQLTLASRKWALKLILKIFLILNKYLRALKTLQLNAQPRQEEEVDGKVDNQANAQAQQAKVPRLEAYGLLRLFCQGEVAGVNLASAWPLVDCKKRVEKKSKNFLKRVEKIQN